MVLFSPFRLFEALGLQESEGYPHQGGSVCLHSDWRWISGSSAGCLVALPICGVVQGGCSPTGVMPHIGGQGYAAIFTGGLSKYA